MCEVGACVLPLRPTMFLASRRILRIPASRAALIATSQYSYLSVALQQVLQSNLNRNWPPFATWINFEGKVSLS
jgi:hypothetical protein